MGQVPTLLNFSDIGTKCLPRARLNFLLHEVGAMDPTTHEMVGQEEHAMVMEQSRSKEAVCKLVKFVKRMSLVLGVQGLESFGAEAADAETCKISDEGDNGWWMIWIFLLMLLVLWAGTAIAVYKVWKGLNTELQHCCTQLADQDGFAANLEKHIYEQTMTLDAQDKVIKDLRESFEETFAHLSDRINETSNELSMLHDYTTGLHYSLVEHGGFLRNGMGLSREQWSHLNVLERANLISSRRMGSVEYMRLVGQRVTPVFEADDTDGVEVENDEPMTEVPELPPEAEMEPESHEVEEMLELLKQEHDACLNRNEFWDAHSIQNTILRFLDDVRLNAAENMIPQCREKISSLFSDLAERAIQQNRWASADRYTAVSGAYSGR